jgi:hypothetical protein
MSRKTKELVLGEYNFTIKQFTPQTACFWAFRLLGSLGEGALFGDLSKAIGQFIGMQRADFSALMYDCLSVVNVQMESGPQAFYRADGGFAVMDPENPIVFELVVEAFTFSLAPFLNKEMIARLKNSLVGCFPQATGPENSSSDQ